jgi:hypothetical protein
LGCAGLAIIGYLISGGLISMYYFIAYLKTHTITITSLKMTLEISMIMKVLKYLPSIFMKLFPLLLVA